MPYKAVGKCVYRKDTGKKVGCTTGSVKKYLAALHMATGHEESVKKITQKDVMAGIRKTMPPPVTTHKDKKTYNRKKFKSFKDYWDEDVNALDGSQKVTDDTTATAEAVYMGAGNDQDPEPNISDEIPGSKAPYEPIKYEDEDVPAGTGEYAPGDLDGAAPETENFIDHKGPGKPGDSKRHGIKKHTSLTSLDKIVHSKTASPRKKQLAHWQANMRRGKAKK